MKNNNEIHMEFLRADSIAQNPSQPRCFFNERAMTTLVSSIKKYGLINPITVRHKSRDEYEIISGERRFRACVSADIEYIPAVVMECDAKTAAIITLSQNLRHENLLFTEVAKSYADMIDNFKMTREELALALDKSITEITQYLKIADLPPFVHKLIREYDLSAEHALALLKLKNARRQIEVVQKVCLNHLTPQQTEYMVREVNDIHRRTGRRFVRTQLRDAHFFESSISRTLDIIRKNGIDADMEEISHDWGSEYRIKIINSDKCNNKDSTMRFSIGG